VAISKPQDTKKNTPYNLIEFSSSHWHLIVRLIVVGKRWGFSSIWQVTSPSGTCSWMDPRHCWKRRDVIQCAWV